MPESDQTDVLTFLFTDIEGSTARWEANPPDMAAAVRRHDELTVSAIQRAGGTLVKTTGDGAYAAFKEADAAVAAALDLRDRLQEEAWPESIAPIRIRAGIHTGPAEFRNGDYFGPTLNRAARLMDAGHGGQILLSDAARRRLPTAADNIRFLGDYRLRDLLQSERIYQVGDPRESHGPLRVLNDQVHNLPTQVTSFVGRDNELIELIDRVRTHRLVTLTGPGGTGKTRLALQAAANLVDTFDSVCFVGLASISRADDVGPAICDALCLRDQSSLSASERLARHFSGRADLLLLDNYEHLMDAAPLPGELLDAAPGLHIVVTSRELLRLRAEHQFPVAPLGLPSVKHETTTSELPDNEAVRLFAERARAIRPDFRIDTSNATSVVAICRRLDGLPLAIELAAARVRLFSPARLLEHLESGDNALGSGPVDAPQRQQTLTRTIAWSYDLLTHDEKALFRRLAVFVGGRSLDAVERVCLPGLGIDCLAAVEALTDKSLVRVREERSGEPRLDLLETLQGFAHARLLESGELEELKLRHARYFADLVAEAETEMRGRGQIKWTRRLEEERPNLDAAMAWSFDSGDNRHGLRIVAGLRDFWFYQTHVHDMGRWTTRALTCVDEGDPILLAGVLMTAGFHASSRHDSSAIDLLDQAAALYESAGDRTHHALAQVWSAGAREMFEDGLDDARVGVKKGLDLAREAGADAVVAQALNYLGEIERYVGNFALAREIQAEGLELSRRTGEVRRVAMMTHNLGWLAHNTGDDPTAERMMREALDLAVEYEFISLVAEALIGLAALTATRGNHEIAARLIGFADDQFARMGARAQMADDADHVRTRNRVSEHLGAERYRLLIAEGAALELEDVLSLLR